MLMLLSIAPNFVEAQIQLDEQKWKELKEGKEYVEKAKEKEEEPEEVEEDEETYQPPSFDLDLTGLGYILVATVAVLLIIAIIILVNQSSKSASVKINRKQAQTLEEAEDDLPDVELTDLFQEQINQGEFKKAMRVKFLMILQVLIDQNQVNWHKRKTNQQYAGELKNRSLRLDFKRIANQFDTYWYGDKELVKEQLDLIIRVFEAFIQKLEKSE